MDNRLAQVLTGEGKSYVLAGLSTYFALIGYQVDCVCYSRLLSNRDFESFKELFTALNVSSMIFYGTFGEVTEKLFTGNDFDIREIAKSILTERREVNLL